MRTAWNAALQKWNVALICALSVGLGFSLAANYYHHSAAGPVMAATKAQGPANWSDGFVQIADDLAPSVVSITSEKTVERSDPFGDLNDFFNFGPFSSPNQSKKTDKELATGSGVIVRSDGYIITNNHVVADADRVTVKLADGREFKGKTMVDPRTDLAVVKIDAKDLPAAQFADSDKVRVGQWAIAIGSPFRLRNTLTVGVVSAIRNESSADSDDNLPECIQTDASINPGNSGGPLVDVDGKIIGINFMIYSQSGGNQGIGFAIPSNTVKYVMDQLITHGKVVRGYLGLLPSDLTPVLSDKLGTKSGALVESIDKDSPAEKGGIKVKDVIVSVDGKAVKNANDLRHTIQAMTPNSEAKIVVVREKKEKTLSVKLGEAPSGDEDNSGSTGGKIGLSVQPLTADIAKALGIDSSIQGVVVRSVESGSAGDRAGIRVKDVIMEIDNTPVTSVATFSKVTGQLKSGDTAIVVVQRGDRSVILEMPIE